MQIGFEVGAKAARLIGRENITDVDGALIELIKNAYDADASCVYVCFDMPFPEVPDTLPAAGLREMLREEDYYEVLKCYMTEKSGLVKKKLTEEENGKLKEVLEKYNQILVIDNGSGMNEQTVTTSWMQIGTSSKEEEIKSERGRIKTGAKGIGRFALDKLSLVSRMYTRKMHEEILYWQVDWNQFANAKLLKDVKATIEKKPYSYQKLCQRLMGEDYDKYKNYGWEHGTAFVLSPCRGEWSHRLFEKVNNSLKSVNPLGFSDTFDIYIHNLQNPAYDFKPQEDSVSKSDYDYKIGIRYDGQRTLQLSLERNEVNITKRTVHVKFSSGKTEKLQTGEFWERPAFQKDHYRKADFEKTILFSYDIQKLLGQKDSLEKIMKVGPFSGKLYFLKNANSDYDIIKPVAVRRRQDLTRRFSGIKIYRDDFKVRPYGDPGSFSDWLELGARQRKENQPVSNLTAPWRVLPNQIIGSINITRMENPELEDMANRESLTMNESFFIFQDILKEAVTLFEYDRQYIYREYRRWTEEKEKQFSPVVERVKAQVKSKRKQKNSSQGNDSGTYNSEEDPVRDGGFTREDYEDTVEDLLDREKKNIHAQQLLHMIADAGLIMNTFFHEFRSIATQLRVRAPQLRRCVNYILNDVPFQGDEIYDPYYRLDDLQSTDAILKDWLDIAMLGTDQENLEPEFLDLGTEIKRILKQWKQILENQYIASDTEDVAENGSVNMSRTDLYIIMNNFVLNSVSYLEKCTVDRRIIKISLWKDKRGVKLLLENNGPRLDEELRNTPDRIFELGFSTKRNRTGKRGYRTLGCARSRTKKQRNRVRRCGPQNGIWIDPGISDGGIE